MKKEKRHEKIKNNPANVRFEEVIQWLKDWGFVLERVKGSHHILRHPETRAKLNMQKDKSGKAKPYQIRQALKVISKMEE